MAPVRPPSRRAFLSGLVSLVGPAGAIAFSAPPARAQSGFPGASADGLQSRVPTDLTVLDLEVDGDKKLATRFTLFVPNHLAKDEKVPLLVLLHGLGETWDPTIGVYAWVERYGLGTAYARLRRPPVGRAWRSGNLLSDARLAQINASIAAQPFRGMAIACPFTPNVQKLPSPEGALDAYAAWIVDVVIPRARREPHVLGDAAHTAIDGVSLGGYVGMEVFLRRPEAFAAVGGVQSAFNVVRIGPYAEKLAAALGKAPKTSVHLETSESDPFREVNTALAGLLTKKGLASDLVVLPGLHDQVFHREAGTLEMLLWHDRRLR
jgi:pimeloyl-ACP methyl ester carboxylesterase